MKTCKNYLHCEACNSIDLADIFDPVEECTHFTNRSEWVHLPSDEYTFTIRGDIAKELIVSNCRAAERSIENDR